MAILACHDKAPRTDTFCLQSASSRFAFLSISLTASAQILKVPTEGQRVAAARILLVALFVGSVAAQPLIPAKGGLVSYADEAYLDDKSIDISPSHLTFVKYSSVVRTAGGRAEVILGACAVIWLGENSSFRMGAMEANHQSIDVLAGSLVIATGAGDSNPTIRFKGFRVDLKRKGAYRFDVQPPEMKVMSGKAVVRTSDQVASVTGGRFFAPDAPVAGGKIDTQRKDALEVWSDERATLLSHMVLQPPVRDSASPRPPTGGDRGGIYDRGLKDISVPGSCSDFDNGCETPNPPGIRAKAPPVTPSNQPASVCTVSPWK
jgi:hypothetical protein